MLDILSIANNVNVMVLCLLLFLVLVLVVVLGLWLMMMQVVEGLERLLDYWLRISFDNSCKTVSVITV